MKTQLLCTFTSKPRLNDTLDIIIGCNEVLYEKVYVFQNENDLGQLICTYNIEYKYDYEENIIDTISSPSSSKSLPSKLPLFFSDLLRPESQQEFVPYAVEMSLLQTP